MDWLLFSMLADGTARVSGHTPPWLLCRSFCLTTQSKRGRARAERAANCGLDPTLLTPDSCWSAPRFTVSRSALVLHLCHLLELVDSYRVHLDFLNYFFHLKKK